MFPSANSLKDIYNNEKLFTPSFEKILLFWSFVDSIENWLSNKRKDNLKHY